MLIHKLKEGEHFAIHESTIVTIVALEVSPVAARLSINNQIDTFYLGHSRRFGTGYLKIHRLAIDNQSGAGYVTFALDFPRSVRIER